MQSLPRVVKMPLQQGVRLNSLQIAEGTFGGGITMRRRECITTLGAIHNSAKAGTKKPRPMPGLSLLEIEIRSIPRDDRATEAVIDARSDHINVLTN
jgi:hypothetical protein